MRLVRRLAFLALGAVLWGSTFADPAPPDTKGEPAADEPPKIYQCTDPDGNLSFQDDPCPEPPPAPHGTTKKAKPAVKAPASKPAPAPRKAPAPAPAPAPVSAVTPPAQPEAPARPKDDWVRIAAMNARTEGGAREMSSPERVWDLFVSALRSNDRARALRCMTPAAGSTLAATETDLIARGNSYSGLVIRNDVGPRRIAGATKRNGRITWVFFERTPSGEWRIASM